MEIHRFAIELYYQENEQFVRVLSVVISKYRILKLAAIRSFIPTAKEKRTLNSLTRALPKFHCFPLIKFKKLANLPTSRLSKSCSSPKNLCKPVAFEIFRP